MTVNKDLNTDRFLLIICALLYFFWRDILFNIDSSFYDPFWQRLLVAGTLLSAFILTFVSNVVRNKLKQINYYIIYGAIVHQTYLIYSNNFSNEYFIGFIIVIVICNAYFRHIVHLVIFAILITVSISVLFFLNGGDFTPKFIFYLCSVLTINLFQIFFYYNRYMDEKNLRNFSLELMESENKFRQLMESAPDAMVIINTKGEIVKTNKRLHELFGHNETDLIGEKIEILIPGRFRDENIFEEKYQQNVIDKGIELYGLNHEKHEFPIEIRLSPIKQINNDTSKGSSVANFTIASIRDITFRIKADQELKKMSLIASKSNNSIIVLSKEGTIEWVNESFIKLSRYKYEQVINKNIASLNDFHLSEIFLNISKLNTEISSISFESNFYSLQNELNYYYTTLTALYNKKGEIDKIISIDTDITKLKLVESELNSVKETLKKKEVIEKISRARGEFISKMSHEIRTPLNGIYGFIHLLLQEELSAQQQKYAETIKFSSDILLTLINDILDYTNFERENIVLNEDIIDLNVLVHKIIKNFEHGIASKNLNVQINIQKAEGIQLIGDPLRISQIIINLLSNAIKFSNDKGKIDLEISSVTLDQEECMLKISVKDEGIGIPQDKQDMIFEPFMQGGKDISKEYGGTGLGLSIISQLVNLMKGKITLESGREQGACFSVEIPLKIQNLSSEIESKPFVHEKNPENERFNILLVEDNKINQFLTESILGKSGYKIDITNNGKEAIDLIQSKEKTFDLILMDLMMPIMDGYESADYIKNTLKLKTPIIALTADVKSNVLFEKEKDFNAYLKKPFKEEEIITLIKDFLN